MPPGVNDPNRKNSEEVWGELPDDDEPYTPYDVTSEGTCSAETAGDARINRGDFCWENTLIGGPTCSNYFGIATGRKKIKSHAKKEILGKVGDLMSSAAESALKGGKSAFSGMSKRLKLMNLPTSIAPLAMWVDIYYQCCGCPESFWVWGPERTHRVDLGVYAFTKGTANSHIIELPDAMKNALERIPKLCKKDEWIKYY